MKTLIVTQLTAAVEDVSIQDDEYVSFGQSGLSSSEVIKFQVDFNGVWTDIMPAVELTAFSNYMQVAGPGTYRVVKPVTTNPTTVYVDE